MDPGLHVKQAITHLEKVIKYAPMVAKDRNATVHLTAEDWQVVVDAMFHMDTPSEFFPATIEKYRMAASGQAVELEMSDLNISIEIF